ncbi:TnsA endonuclease N-terminal domain-containing protein [Sulfurovum sp.]|uniref:TnsA endonuclease N-terminal domain-containing protein n=1 Tax=Sulfurovum sp. TaxID=1969726 RepID=UPI0035668F51
MKNRKIGYTYGSVSGRYSFRKEKSIAFESTLERDLIALLEFNDSVIDVIEQPVTLEYVNQNGRKTTYTPDFLVYFKTSPAYGMSNHHPRPMLIEVKPHRILRKKLAELRPKFKIAMKYARENGYIFKIYDENRIRGQELKNINFISRHKNLGYDDEEERRIIEHLKAVGHTTVDHLLAHLYVTDEQRGIGLGQTWHLLANKKIACDIGMPLGQHTVIWLNVDESYEEGVWNG